MAQICRQQSYLHNHALYNSDEKDIVRLALRKTSQHDVYSKLVCYFQMHSAAAFKLLVMDVYVMSQPWCSRLDRVLVEQNAEFRVEKDLQGLVYFSAALTSVHHCLFQLSKEYSVNAPEPRRISPTHSFLPSIPASVSRVLDLSI